MRVEQLNVGWFTAPAGFMRRGEPLDQPARLPIPAYLIETGEQRILVDTGLHPAAVADAAAFYDGSPAMDVFALEQDLTLAEQVDLATVTLLVLTHLHFDHAGSLPLIPAAVPLVIQRREWDAAHDRSAVERNFFLPRDYGWVDERRLEA